LDKRLVVSAPMMQLQAHFRAVLRLGTDVDAGLPASVRRTAATIMVGARSELIVRIFGPVLRDPDGRASRTRAR
jgi:hypothetical protein